MTRVAGQNAAGTSQEEGVLSREELDALLEELPRGLATAFVDDAETMAIADVELQRANERFAADESTLLSNRHQRVVAISLIGQREIELTELSELMLPTDLASAIRLEPAGVRGFLLLSRPFFFQLLSMSFGSGPTIKPTRPPVRSYTRIERRFYERATREMTRLLSEAWAEISPIEVKFEGVLNRSAVAEAEAARALLASFDVKGFGEVCRIRVAIPAAAFPARERKPTPTSVASRKRSGVSLLDVPIRLRARVGSAELPLGEVGRLKPGVSIPLDVPSDGALTVVIGKEPKFHCIAGKRGTRRAIRLRDRIGLGEATKRSEGAE